MTTPVKPVATMGERLREQALRIAERHRMPMHWGTMLAATLQRDAARSQPVHARWRRIEARQPPGAPLLPSRTNSTDAPMPPAMPGTVPEPPVPRANRMHLHEGPLADTFARDHRADAVSVGQDVYLRDKKVTPLNDRLPLLAHEASHVRRFLEPHAAWQRSTSAGVREEEAQALESERVASRSPLVPEAQLVQAPAPKAPAAVAASASSPSLRPMPAETARNPMPSPGAAAPASSGADMRSIRERIMRDIIDNVRVDAERGG